MVVAVFFALLVSGCGSEPSSLSESESLSPWAELCNAHCGTLESLTDKSTQKCGRPAGREQSECLGRIVSEISAIERDLPAPDIAGITGEIDTIFETSGKYGDSECGSGRVRGSLPAATCTIQSITIETSARSVLSKMRAESGS